jgi:hypothetical protein
MASDMPGKQMLGDGRAGWPAERVAPCVVLHDDDLPVIGLVRNPQTAPQSWSSESGQIEEAGRSIVTLKVFCASRRRRNVRVKQNQLAVVNR